MNPPYFYGIENFPITSIIHKITGLPTFLVNDANAGALAEKLYGIGKDIPNFTYLHIMNGIGSGLVLKDSLYEGDTGQSGEIGHTSINFAGPQCACGNKGCLDLYANVDNMRQKVFELSPFYPASPLASVSHPTWYDIVDCANRKDALAIIVIEEFCSYVSYALINTLNLLNIATLIVGYDSSLNGFIIEDDYDSEFRYKGKPIPALQGSDSNGKVIYTGTFSKSLAPSIRMSYMVLPEHILKIYQEKCRFISSTVSKVDQMILQKFMEEGYYERHLNKTRALYKNRHDVLISSLRKMKEILEISGENAGVHLLLHFKTDNSEKDLIEKAAKQGVRVYGLSEYCVKDNEDSTGKAVILLGYANMNEERIRVAVQLLCKAWE